MSTHPLTERDAMSEHRPLATRAEVAEYLRVPIGTLEQWAYRGTGPTYTRVGRHARYRWADVEMWLEAQQHEAA
jgi:excisionase family DNA binding protein